MHKFILILIILSLIFIPIFFTLFNVPNFGYVLKNYVRHGSSNDISTRYITSDSRSSQKLKLIDTSYLDFEASKLDIFKKNSIVDPSFYRTGIISNKFTVSKIEFELMDDLDNYVFAASGKNDFASKGNYSINGDILHVQVSINPNQVIVEGISPQYAIEEIFLKTVFTTLLYAKGFSNPQETAEIIFKIQEDMNQYLKTGLFPWPIQIQKI